MKRAPAAAVSRANSSPVEPSGYPLRYLGLGGSNVDPEPNGAVSAPSGRLGASGARKPRRENTVKPKRPGSAKAHDRLEKACRDLAWLKYGIKLWKVDSKPVRITTSHGFQFVSRAQSGWPDSVAFIPPFGMAFFAEFKSGGGYMRKDQNAVADQLRTAGAEVHTFRDIDSFDMALRIAVEGERLKASALRAVTP